MAFTEHHDNLHQSLQYRLYIIKHGNSVIKMRNSTGFHSFIRFDASSGCACLIYLAPAICVVDLVMVALFSSKIVSFHHNFTTSRKIVKQGTKSDPNPEFEDKNSVLKISKYHTQFNTQLSRILMFHISFYGLKCAIARSRARCYAAARNRNDN